MRPELIIALFLFVAIGAINVFQPFPAAMSEFLLGMLFVLTIFFHIVNLLPKEKYDKLLYRKWLADK